MAGGPSLYSSPQHLSEHPLNLPLRLPDLGLDLGQRTQGSVAIEVPGEWNLVADLRLLLVDPSVRDVRQNLPLEVDVDVLLQRNVLVVPEVGERLRTELGVHTDLGGLVPLRQGRHDGLQD